MTGLDLSDRAAGNSLITYRVGGREYPMRTNRRCKVCQSPYRFDIEEALVLGRTYRRIAEALPEDAELTKENIRNHYHNQHLPLDASVTREIVEARAAAVGKKIEDGVQSLVDGLTLAEVVVQKTFEAIARGELSPEIRDGMAAAKFLADLGQYEDGGADMGAITEAFIVYHEHAQEFMSPEQFQAFGEALDRNPVLKSLAAKYNGEPETVQGEVVQDES